jgi:hypothetical protein
MNSLFLKEYILIVAARHTTVRPFGSYKLATYIMRTINLGAANKELYRFTTSIYSQEESVELLLSKKVEPTIKIKIIKRVKGVEEIIYHESKKDYPKPGLLYYQGKQWTITELAKFLKVKRQPFAMRLYRTNYDLNKVLEQCGKK